MQVDTMCMQDQDCQLRDKGEQEFEAVPAPGPCPEKQSYYAGKNDGEAFNDFAWEIQAVGTSLKPGTSNVNRDMRPLTTSPILLLDKHFRSAQAAAALALTSDEQATLLTEMSELDEQAQQQEYGGDAAGEGYDECL